ncbi:hypothetical protein GCM10010172_07350 [Paractinoplanes ferrugineus]|uniref:Uncharacterized protein n=1 Tax=Paractinoplanes ferrugineus TaxID=113564 RepID=A0A919MEE4_9ACTN|nr:hypothetical protein Afe05nite_86260 [Actinoplanes ferrugineus]
MTALRIPVAGRDFDPLRVTQHDASYSGCDSCGTCIGCDGCADEDNPIDLERGDCTGCGACGPCIAECAALRSAPLLDATKELDQ